MPVTVPVIAVTAACLYMPLNIDAYLNTLYERAPKFDQSGQFGWKDQKAAERLGMSLKQYVIGGVEEKYRNTYARAMNFAEVVFGLKPAINSGFRDDYRQSLVSDHAKANVGYSFHGGSHRGGWGRGLAFDTVSATATSTLEKEREAASRPLWAWIDTFGPSFGIGRPYGDRDAPHVAPIDGQEYAMHHDGHRHILLARHHRHYRARKKIHLAHSA